MYEFIKWACGLVGTGALLASAWQFSIFARASKEAAHSASFDAVVFDNPLMMPSLNPNVNMGIQLLVLAVVGLGAAAIIGVLQDKLSTIAARLRAIS